jgi:hypothetical protein
MKQKEGILRIEPLISRFPLCDLDLDFFARAKRYNVLEYTVISYQLS